MKIIEIENPGECPYRRKTDIGGQCLKTDSRTHPGKPQGCPLEDKFLYNCPLKDKEEKRKKKERLSSR